MTCYTDLQILIGLKATKEYTNLMLVLKIENCPDICFICTIVSCHNNIDKSYWTLLVSDTSMFLPIPTNQIILVIS